MNNQTSLHSIEQIRMQCNDFKSCLQSNSSGRILKSAAIIRECNTEKNSNRYIKGIN